jgi:glycosyltransferase involved in cell wall biosynthesis
MMEPFGKRFKILLSAYACEPHRGSEPGVGWEWACRIALWHDVTVLTRSNNSEAIHAALGSGGNPKFLFHDLPEWVIKLKKLGIIPVQLYYLLWQLTAARTVKKTARNYDLIHHVTFNGFRFPGAWWSKDMNVVLGPLGGGSITAPQYKKCFGARWFFERLRESSIRLWRLNPWTVASLKNAKKILVVGEELKARFQEGGFAAEVMLETALPRDLEAPHSRVPANYKRDFIWVGNLEPWKAWQIAMEAFALAVSKGMDECRLKIIGKGHQDGLAKAAALRLGIADRVDFMGQKPRDEVWRMMANSRGLIFSSIRDTSGNVVLEAMGLNCPIVCFQHQGVAMMTDPDCAIMVKPESWHESVLGFANAMKLLNSNDEIVSRMGDAGRERAISSFSWDGKIKAMKKIYFEACENSALHQAC